MLNIVIPMAGRGSRFQNVGFLHPKPLIPVHGVPMINLVVRNLAPLRKHRFIFLCLQDHILEFEIDVQLKSLFPSSIVVPVTAVTQGAACTVLLAEDLIDNNDPLMIANSDQWIDCDIEDYLRKLDEEEADGLIMTMKATDAKWSFVRLDHDGKVVEVVEKIPVSNEATVGVYNFRRGEDFVAAAKHMIEKNRRVNGEFYVAPVYNELITAGKRVSLYNIGCDSGEPDGVGKVAMYGLGIPEDLERFKATEISHKAVKL